MQSSHRVWIERPTAAIQLTLRDLVARLSSRPRYVAGGRAECVGDAGCPIKAWRAALATMAIAASLAAVDVTGAQVVTPKGTLVSASPNSSGSYTFSVYNDGSVANRFTLTAACTGASVTNCAVSGSTLLRVNAHATANVVVTYNTGAYGDGQVLLTASDDIAGTSDQGSITIGLPSATPQWSQNNSTWYTSENYNTNYPWFHLRNQGNTAVQFPLSVSCTGNISNCSVSSPSPMLAAGSSTDITVYYRSGSGTGATGTITLTATSPYGPTTSTSLTIVPLSAAVTVSPKGGTASVEPGADSAAAFAVSDVGNASPVTYTLSASCSGVVTSCSAPTSVQVNAGSPQTVNASYGVSSNLAGGTGGVALSATWTDNVNTYTDQGTYTITVPDRRTYTVGVTPAGNPTAYTAEHVSTNYIFTVTNSGNTAATYTLSLPTCTGTQSGCTFSSSTGPTTTTLTLAANGSASVPVYFTSLAAGQNANIALRADYGATTGSASVTLVPLSEAVSATAQVSSATQTYGTNSSYAFTISATGNNTSPITYTLTTSCTGAVSCPATPTPASVTISPGSPATTAITATATSSPTGGPGTVTVTASYTNSWGQSYTGQASTSVTVPDQSNYTPQVTPDADSITYAEANVATTATFKIKNVGNMTAPYTLTVPTCTGTLNGCSLGNSPNPVLVDPGHTVSVPVTFTTMGMGTTAHVKLHAAATPPSGPVYADDGSLQVITLSDSVVVAATDGAPSTMTNGSGTYHFTVTNVGNNDNVTYTLQVTGCGAPLSGCTTPAPITLNHGQSQTVAIAYQTLGTAGTGTITLRAVMQAGNLYQSAATGTITVTSRLAVSTAFMNTDNQDVGLCAASCFAMTAARSTVPYVTLDAARSVTLVYHGDRAFPRPFVYADVSIVPPSPAVDHYLLQVTRNGLRLPFTNGDSVLVFQGTTLAMRLAGQLQLDPAAYPTGAYPVTVTVTAVYSDQTTDVTAVPTSLLVVNTRQSSIAKGWSVAGVPRLYPQTDGSAVIEDGTGSALVFQNNGGNFAAPQGDYTTLTARSGGQGWTRTSLDNTTVWFSPSGLADSVTDRVGFATRFEYDNVSRLKRIYDPMLLKSLGLVARAATTLNYGSTGLATIQEPNPVAAQGRVTQVHVGADSLLTAILDPDNDSTAYGYDANQRLASVTDRNGNTTTYGYGPTWQLAHITSPPLPIDNGGGTTTTQQPVVTLAPWQAVGVPTAATTLTAPGLPVRADTIVGRITDANGNASTFTVNRWGQPMTVTDPLGNVTAYTRNGTRVTMQQIPDGRPNHIAGTNVYGYTGAYLTMAQQAGSDTVNYAYGAAGQITDISGLGVVAEQHFLRADGRVDSVQFAGSTTRVTRYQYDTLTKRVVTLVNAARDTTQYIYDPVFGNLVHVVAPGGRSVTHVLDAYGRDSIVTTPAASSYALYDNMNRATYDSVAGNSGATRMAYFHDHQTVTDANGNTYQTDFNALGWITAEHHPNSSFAPITHRYDRLGRATSMTNRRGQIVSATYDALGRMLTRTDGVSTTTFRYPWLQSMVAVGPKFTDSTATMLVCATSPTETSSTCMSDTTVVTYGGVSYTMGHTTPGRFTDTATVTNSEYDPNAPNQSFVTSRSYYQNPDLGVPSAVTLGPLTLSYTYDDSLGLRTGTTLPGALGTRSESFTTNQELTATRYSLASIDASYARAYHYDLAGRLDVMQRSENGSPTSSVLRSFAYDDQGQLSGMAEWTTPCGMWPSAGVDSLSAAQGWRYDCGGTVTTSESYTYDAVGNRMTVTANGTPTQATYETGNRLSTMGSRTYTYDDDGNLIRQQNATTGEDRHFYYDATGQLDSLIVSGGPTPGALYLEYDPVGRLAHRTWYDATAHSTTVRLYLWRGADLTKEIDVSDGTTREYEYDGTDHPILQVVRDGTGAVVGKTTYLYDATGSVIGGVTAGATGDGTPVPLITYTPWGEVTSVANTPSTTRFGFKGMLYDEAVGLYYARARWYDPAAGRFTQEDPIGLAGGINLYAYVGDDPVNGSDPSGLAQEDDFGSKWCARQGLGYMGFSNGNGFCVVGGAYPLPPDYIFGTRRTSDPFSWVFSQPVFGSYFTQSSGKNDFANASSAAGVFGIGAGVFEVAGSGRRIGSNFKFYSPKFFGNQSVSTADVAKVSKGIGGFFFAVGTAFDLVDWQSGRESGAKFAANTAVGGAATMMGGPEALLLGVMYSGVDHTLGWGNVLGRSDCTFVNAKVGGHC